MKWTMLGGKRLLLYLFGLEEELEQVLCKNIGRYLDLLCYAF